VVTELTVSVVVPTFNRRDRLHRVLEALGRQADVPAFETVVVSDGSTDDTDEYLASADVPIPVVARRQANQGPAVARNHGVEVASGSLIVFLDDDVVPTPGLLAAHLAAHRRLGDRAVVIGPMLDPPDHWMSMWVRWEQAMLSKQYRAMEKGEWMPTARQFYTGNASVRREHMIAVGGFDPEFRRAEDVELAFRLDGLGLTFAFEPSATGLHYAERSFDSWLATGRAYGRNDVVFATERGQRWILEVAARELGERRWPVRAVVRVAAGRPYAERVVERALITAARVADQFGRSGLNAAALSGIWNLEYYSGMVTQLGGRRASLRERELRRRADPSGDADQR
jgi:GT2 family glycosyltransferase